MKKQMIEAMMPQIMPMYTTFFMPVEDRPMMTVMSTMSGRRARPKGGMLVSVSTSLSSASST